MSEPNESARWSLRELPMAARLCIAAFMISVGVGYFSALVQLHFQHASPGSLLPSFKDVVKTFHGPRENEKPKSRIETLIMAEEHLPWNGAGQMTAAFTTKSEDWRSALKKKVTDIKGRIGRRVDGGGEDAVKEEAEKELRAERLAERDVIVAWVRAGAPQDDYANDQYCLSPELAGKQITKKYVKDDEKAGKVAKIQSILNDRCARCHTKAELGGDPNLENFRLDDFASVSKYTKVTEAGAAMSIEKLTQTTHIHLLSFSMLYFLTGLALALTRYPGFIKVPLASVPLVVQLIDIACWWLARLPGETGVKFAEAIPVTGAIVGMGLGLQILLTVFDLFGKWGKIVLVLLFIAAGLGTYVVKEKVIDPHMAAERAKIEAKK